MNQQAEAFLAFFDGVHTFQTFDDKGKDPSLAKHKSAQFEQIESQLLDYNKRGAGIFFTVNETDGKGRKAENITKVRAVFLDLDGPESRERLSQVLASKTAPSLVVESSPGKFHCYWLCEVVMKSKWPAIQKALAAKFGGDPAVSDIARVMRLPGFFHNKDKPYLTRIIQSDGQDYSIKEIIEGLELEIDTKPTNTPDADDGLRHLNGFSSGERNKELLRYASSLRARGLGLDEANALVMAQAAACSPPMARDEAFKVLSSAYKFPDKKPKKKDRSGAIFNSDLANAERLINYHGANLRYLAELGWMSWSGEVWEGQADHEAFEYAKDTAKIILKEAANSKGDMRDQLFDWAKKSQDIGKLRAMLAVASTDPRIRGKVYNFDSDPWALNCKNGILNLKTSCLSEHRQSMFCSKISPAIYGESLTHDSLWLSFLRKITNGDEDLQKYLQRLAGYCLTGDISEKCFFFCYGTGDNGKSVFIEVLHELLGSYSLALSTETLIKQKFSGGIPNDVARLCGPRLATVSETGKGETWNEKLLKDLTGGDIITARFLNKEFFDFRPQCKLLIRGNNKPDVKDFSAGLWRRMHLIPFEAQIPLVEQKKDLREQIIILELNGVLKWALDGCMALKDNGLNPPTAVTAAVEEYRQEMDIIGQFLEQNTAPDPTGVLSIKASDLYLAYKKWAEKTGFPCVSQVSFGMDLGQRGLKRVRNKSGKSYTSITLLVEDKNAQH